MLVLVLSGKSISLTWSENYFDGMNGLPPRRVTSLFLILLMAGIQSCSLVFPVIAPFSDLPPPTGPFAVATRTACWVDSSREEYFTAEADLRRIVVQVWYPQQEAGAPSPYIDYPEIRIPALAKQLRLPASTIQHIKSAQKMSTQDGPAHENSSGFPVILFSHGLSGMRFQNTALMEEMASYGYVLLAPDHSYDANVAIFGDGDLAEYRAGKKRILTAQDIVNIDMAQLSYRVNDLKFILDEIMNADRPQLVRDIPMDIQNVGLIGHSLGGTTALATMVDDHRFKASLILDGWYTPLPDSVIQRGLDRPLLHLGQVSWHDSLNYQQMDRLFSRSSMDQTKILLPHAKHTDFTDMPLFSPFSYRIGYTGIDNPLATLKLIRSVNLIFFDTYLRTGNKDDLDAFMMELRGVSLFHTSKE